MASVVDICNLALSRLGDDATVSSIDPPEGSAQAEHCARFYSIARDVVLTMHAWCFATRVVNGAELVGQARSGWRHAYSIPTNAITLVNVTAVGESKQHPFVVEAQGNGNSVVLTNCDVAALHYIARTTDPGRFPALFQDALVWLLASHLAGPLIKGDSGAKLAQTAYQAYLGALDRAISSDMRQYQPESPSGQTPWIVDR